MLKVTNTFRVLISVIFLTSSLMACGGGGSSSNSDSNVGADSTASGRRGVVPIDTSLNDAPRIAAVADQSINAGSSLSLRVSATDPDGDLVSIRSSGLQSWMSFDGTTFSANPGAGTTGSFTVTFTASDGSLSDQESFVLTVGLANQPPPPVPAGDATAVEFPRGIYSSSADREALEQPYTEGALVRGAWDQLEVSRGAYDLSGLERQVDIVRGTGKKWTLAIAAGPSTPGFYGNERVSFVWRNENQSMPTPWDTDYLTGLRELMTAIANVYANDPDLQMVYVPLISPNGIEGSWTEETTPSWSSFGYTEQRHADGILEAIDIVTDTFPGKAVVVEMHQINRSTVVPETVIAGMDKTRVGIAAWWLGQGTYQPNMQEVFRQFSGAKIGQIIAAQANEPDPDKGFRLTGYDGQPWGLEGVYQMAQDMGISYVEPWPLDVKGYPEILGNWSF